MNEEAKIDEQEIEEMATGATEDEGAGEQAEKPEAQNSTVEVRISDDLMTAYVKFTEPQNGGASPGEVDVLKALSSSRVTYGINTDLIKQLCANPRYNHEMPVAEGFAPTRGKDARLILSVRIGEKPKPVEREDGSVDFSDLNLVTEVEKGQTLCERVPPTEGTPGMSVTGKPISAMRGVDKPLPSGANTAIVDDETKLVSVIEGRVDLVADRITVSQNFEIRGDVDVSTGDIKFKGNVSISGNVMPGRKVEATGNIDIFGMIEGGTVIAGGDVTVRGGVVGAGNPCFIQSQGTVNVRYLEHVNVVAIRDVRAQMILHSEVKCGNLIELYGSKAAIIGGECLCGGNIVVRTVGSNAFVRTILEVGRDPTLAIREEALNEEIKQISKMVSDMERLEAILMQLKNLNRLTPDKEEALDGVLTTKPGMQNKIKIIQKELEEIKNKIWSTTPVEINVTGLAYPGTEIKIGAARAVLEQVIRCKRFSKKDDIIIAK